MSLKPALALPLVLTMESSKYSVIDGPLWIPRREMAETSEDLVEFFTTNGTANKLKDNTLTFLKEALMSKNHPSKDYEELCLSYLFLNGEGQPNHSAILKVSIKPGGWPGPSTASSFRC